MNIFLIINTTIIAIIIVVVVLVPSSSLLNPATIPKSAWSAPEKNSLRYPWISFAPLCGAFVGSPKDKNVFKPACVHCNLDLFVRVFIQHYVNGMDYNRSHPPSIPSIKIKHMDYLDHSKRFINGTCWFNWWIFANREYWEVTLKKHWFSILGIFNLS